MAKSRKLSRTNDAPGLFDDPVVDAPGLFDGPVVDDPDGVGDPPDQEMRSRILTDLDTTMLVEAAAGTGKTTSMVGRMIALLREGKCRIETLAAVTFTRKAAAELRDRFRIELERQARSKAVAPPRLVEALAHIDHCFIGTIHSFCARLLRERPVEAGVDLSFFELDTERDEQLRNQAWDEHVAHLFAADDPILGELDALGLPINKLSGAIRQYADYLDVQVWPAQPGVRPDFARAIQALREYAAHMSSLAPFPVDRGHDRLMGKYELIARMVEQSDMDRESELMEILEQCVNTNVVQKNWPGGPEQGKEEQTRWDEFREDIADPMVRHWRERRYQVVQRVLEAAVAVNDRLRQQLGGLNYQDLLIKSAELLRGQPRIRRYFRARFTHLLVDEFQDTDPIQAEVMLLLTADDPTEADWRKCRPVPGSLFVVGDPKQSIYRFRRADIVTYNQVKEIIEKHGDVVPLSANFRAIGQIIDWVNETFATLFPAVPDDYSPENHPLLIGRTDAGADATLLAGVQVLNIPAEHATADAIVRYEADFVARFIRFALDTRMPVPRTPKELERGGGVAVTPGDFLIITRKKKHLDHYARELDRLGVPNQISGGSALQGVDEIHLLRRCLTALTEPDNPVALVAVLRSELFGISDTALYAFKRAGGGFSFHASMPPDLSAADRGRMADAFGRLQQYYRWLGRLPLPSAVERIVADLGLPGRAAADPGGNVRAGSLAKAVELLRGAHAPMHTAVDLVEYLGRLLDDKIDVEGALARVPQESVVRLMNLHQAKGLEAPIVLLIDPTGEQHHEVELHIDRGADQPHGYLAIRGEARGHHKPLLAHPPDWSDWQQEEEAFQNAEKLRLLYVAATRAGACLVISQRDDRNDRNPWRTFKPRLEDCPALEDPGTPEPARGTDGQSILQTGDWEAAQRAIRTRWQTPLRPTYAVLAAKKVAVREGAPPPPPAGETDADSPVGEHGTEWGTAIHLLLETAIREPTADLRKLAYDKLGDIESEGGDRGRMADLAVDTVAKVMKSAIWRRAQASQRCFVEVPFDTLWPAGDGLPTVVRGVIDLIFREPDGWVLVDYKTHHGAKTNRAALIDMYGPQIRLYADIWQKLVGEPVREVGLYFTADNQYVPVRY
jgi:ATP-dependent helicase/nuclease subunit A